MSGGSASSQLAASRREFFDAFGYVHAPGEIRDDAIRIADEFERAWIDRPDQRHDGTRNTTMPGLHLLRRPRLTALLEHPAVTALADALLGEGWQVQGGDGNFYAGDTPWHQDHWAGEGPAKTTLRHLKIAFYLDALTRDTGALRVIPGSHLHGDRFSAVVKSAIKQMPGRDVPAVAIESRPGDLVAFDHRLWHASFGGCPRRRMFTMNLVAPCRTEEQREAALTIMRNYRDREGARWQLDEAWLATMSPACRARFAQRIEFGAIVRAEAAPAAR